MKDAVWRASASKQIPRRQIKQKLEKDSTQETKRHISEVNIEQVEESIHPYETTTAAPDLKPSLVAAEPVDAEVSKVNDNEMIEDIELIE